MAIYAEISHKSISVSVTHRKLDLSASLVPALDNQISFSKLVGAANWRNLYLFDVHVNAQRAMMHYQSFANAIGMKTQADSATTPVPAMAGNA